VGSAYAQRGTTGGSVCAQRERQRLGPILDVATLLTAGAGGVARIGNILSKAGAVSSAEAGRWSGHARSPSPV
jgi:hypothetical protein